MEQRDPIMQRITGAIELCQAGDRDAARARFEEIWKEIDPGGDPLHRCTLAHYMADLQDDPRDELRWDLRALEAADALTDERLQQHHPSLTLRSFQPSLHLNLAEDYRKLGDLDRARAHLARAAQSADALPDSGLGAMIRGGIARLTDQLAGGATD